MEFDRRKFMRMFGVGAAVVPIIGGAPLIEAEARLVEPAKVVPVSTAIKQGELNDLLQLFMQRELIDIAIGFRAKSSARPMFFGPPALTDLSMRGPEPKVIDVTSFESTGYVEKIQTRIDHGCTRVDLGLFLNPY